MSQTLAVVRAAFTDATARPAAFWTQVGAMMANDLAMIAFWILFFHQVRSVRGWDADRVFLLFAILATAAGIVLGFLSNARRIPELVETGSLDEALSLPMSPLRYLLVRRVDTVNVGDVAFGVVLFLVTGHPTPQRAALFVGGVVVAATLLTAFLVTLGSVVFFTGRGEPGALGMHAILLLAGYPVDIFTGAAKGLLYTLVPAAFVAAVPARIVDAPSWRDVALMLLATVVFVLLARTAFGLGLRRYTSGSAWGRA